MKIYVIQKLNNINMVGGRCNLHESFLMKPGIPGFGAGNLSISIPHSQGHYHQFFYGTYWFPGKFQAQT
jgi:hypothetical protein